MKKRIETFYELNEQEKQILAKQYGKPDSEKDYSGSRDVVKIPSPGYAQKQNGTGGQANSGSSLDIVSIDRSIADAKITINPVSFVYDGTEKKPDVKVTLENTVISPNVYDVAYSSNRNVGTGIVTVTGKGNYTGTLKGNFEITKGSVNPEKSVHIWIWGAVILTAVITCGILFAHCNSGSEEPAVSSQISQISLQSDTDTVSSKEVSQKSEKSEKSENSVKTSSRESSVSSDESSKESSQESSKESSKESSVNPPESSVDVTSVEEPHQPSVESSKPFVVTESSVYVPSYESSEPSVQESSEEIFVVSDGASGDILTTGTCGENLQYNFNMDSGTLIITGTGDMFDDFVGFQHQNEIKTVSLGSDVTGICENAFESCDNLETVTMADDSKTKIGKNAFLHCTSLRKVHLSANLKKLGSFAFNGCTALEEITIPDTIAQIYNNTFEKCIKLKSVHLSQNITKIDEEAFIDCNKNILTIYAPKGSKAETYAKEHSIKFVAEGTAV